MIRYITAMTIFGSIGVFRRFIPLSSASLACFRGAMGSLFLLAFFLLFRRKKSSTALSKKEFGLLFIIGGLIGLNWIFLFEAYNFTKVSTATLCYYMQPTIVILLSPIFFKEKITLKKGACAVLSVIGMVCISGVIANGGLELGEFTGIGFGLLAATLYAIIVIMNKKLPGLDSYKKTIVQLMAATVVVLPYVLVSGEGFDIGEGVIPIILLFVVGIVHTGFAYLLYFGSMDSLKAQTIAVLGYIDPVVAVLLSAIIIKEPLSLIEITGAVLIIGSALWSERVSGDVTKTRTS